METPKVTKISGKLVGLTCLVTWQENYTTTKEGHRDYLIQKILHLGIGVVVSVSTKSITIALYMSRTKDFGNGMTFSMNIKGEKSDVEVIIPRKKPRRKLYGVNVSNRHMTACYIENPGREIFPKAISGFTWLQASARRSLIAELPKLRKACANHV